MIALFPFILHLGSWQRQTIRHRGLKTSCWKGIAVFVVLAATTEHFVIAVLQVFAEAQPTLPIGDLDQHFEVVN